MKVFKVSRLGANGKAKGAMFIKADEFEENSDYPSNVAFFKHKKNWRGKIVERTKIALYVFESTNSILIEEMIENAENVTINRGDENA